MTRCLGQCRGRRCWEVVQEECRQGLEFLYGGAAEQSFLGECEQRVTI